jgi:hypothetical protein
VSESTRFKDGGASFTICIGQWRGEMFSCRSVVNTYLNGCCDNLVTNVDSSFETNSFL